MLSLPLLHWFMNLPLLQTTKKILQTSMDSNLLIHIRYKNNKTAMLLRTAVYFFTFFIPPQTTLLRGAYRFFIRHKPRLYAGFCFFTHPTTRALRFFTPHNHAVIRLTGLLLFYKPTQPTLLCGAVFQMFC